MELSTDLKELAMGKSKSQEETYKILVGKRLIKDTMTCNYCKEVMNIKHCNDNADYYNWRCMNTSCIHYQTTKSLKMDSIFEGFFFGYSLVYYILYIKVLKHQF